MRLVFMGTPEFAVPTLAAIVGQGHEVAAVYTRAPRPAGRRGLAPTPSPVDRLAGRLGLPTLTPAGLRAPEAAATFRAHGAEAAVVVAYGLILPPELLAAPPLGCLNLHASLLPRWRGAAPIHRAVMAGDAETGVAVMRMEEGLDTGPVAMVERVAIAPDMSCGALHDRLAAIGADLMIRALAALARDALQFTPQPAEGATYARKIEKAEARVDWRRPARELHDHVRGLSPFPGAFFEVDLGAGIERVKIQRAASVGGGGRPGEILDGMLTVACGEGALRLVEVRRAGRSAMPAADFLRGVRLGRGMVLP